MNKKFIVTIASLASVTLAANLLFLSLRRSTVSQPAGPGGEEITGFNYEKIESGLKLVITGEAATITPDKNTTVKAPAAQMETAEGKIILVNTGTAGTAEIVLDPKSGQLQTMVLKGGVTITRKDKKSGQIEFTAESEQATYRYATQEMTLIGNPVVHQGENEFRGETIRYLLKDGKILVEKNASGKILYEEKH
ncbi:MAG: LptA/OstA family protein [Candidatus Omnitrophota bacterium]